MVLKPSAIAVLKNPFSRHTSSKKSVVSKQAERELERELKKLEELDEAIKKLYKDGKRYVEVNNAAVKAEQKIVQDLLNSGLCQNEEPFQRKVLEWERTLDDLNRHRQEYNGVIQKTMIEPMKKLSGVFPSVQTAAKKREQSLQEYNRTQAKFNKYQERERTGQNIVKLDTNKKALETVKEEFTSQDTTLRQDLPALYEGRLEYFQPTFNSQIRAQLTNNNEAFKAYSAVTSELFQDSKLTEKERKTRIMQTLNEIKALSITVDD